MKERKKERWMDGWTVTYVEREKDKYRGTEKKIKSDINR